MRWSRGFARVLGTLSALGACGHSRQAVHDSGHTAAAGSSVGAGGSGGGSEGGAPETGATGGTAAASAAGGSAGKAAPGVGGAGMTNSAGTPSSAGTTSSAGGGATGSAGGPDRDDQTPTAVVPACVNPKPPSGESPLPKDVHVGNTWIRASERDCTWTVGEPMALPLEPDDPSELLFQLDVNGDHIDDLLFGDHANGSRIASGKSLVLLESVLREGELSYERSSCDSPWDVTFRSFFARDLDRDGEPDFVIGRINGVSAMLNRAGERPEILHFDWPHGEGEEWVSILDVALGDFDADGRDDIAVGYDRATGLGGGVESGVVLFRDRSAHGTYGMPEPVIGLGYDPSLPQSPPLAIPAGLLASAPSTGASSALLAFYQSPEAAHATGFRYYGGSGASFLAPSVDFAGPIFAHSAEFMREPTLMVGGPERLEIVKPSDPYAHVGSVAMAYRHAQDHEVGGGYRIRSLFVLDIDGDGDEDLVERGSEDGRDPWTLFIHNRIADGEFADPVLVQKSHQSSRFIETPFVRAGVMPGRLFVSDGSPEQAALWPIACSEGG